MKSAATTTAKAVYYFSCECGEKGIETFESGNILQPTIGLKYTLKGSEYSVTGIGTAKDTHIIIPSVYNGKPVTSIGSQAFYYCKSQTKITLPDSITSIESYAFYDCQSLTTINIPENVTKIGYAAFKDCMSLTNITIPASVTKIDYKVFEGCRNLTSIKVSANNPIYKSENNCLIIKGENILLSGCLSSVIPDYIVCIEECAFSYNNITTITIPNSIKNINYYAFYGCWALTDITYKGTKDEWNAIKKDRTWTSSSDSFIIHCTDGKLDKDGNEVE